MRSHQDAVRLIWDIADLLRGPYRPNEYHRVMLPLTVLRRFDCVLSEPDANKESVVAEYERLRAEGREDAQIDRRLEAKTGYRFHNHSRLDFETLTNDPASLAANLQNYIGGFSANVRRIFEFFKFEDEIVELDRANVLFLIIKRFQTVDLHPLTVDNIRMGLLFEELIRKFNEQANETAGDYFTPREVVRLMVDLLFKEDDAALSIPGTVRTLLDPACGTGGMLSVAQERLGSMHKEARLFVYGQDFNRRAYAIAAADMLMKEQRREGATTPTRATRIEFGDSFLDDKFREERAEDGILIPDQFDYFLANPPFGVDWKRQQTAIEREYRIEGFRGRFGAGLPRVNDGALLFLQHMWSKRQSPPSANAGDGGLGSRLAIVLNGSPLFSGGAGSGESEIRRWILENDWLEAIIALPEQMFYNTGIGTYIWILSNHKRAERRGKVQLIDARAAWVLMRKTLGQKRRRLGEGRVVNLVSEEIEANDPHDDVTRIVELYGDGQEGVYSDPSGIPRATSRLLNNSDFGYVRVAVERPLRLRFAITDEGIERFLNAAPRLYDDLLKLDEALGRLPRLDWNETRVEIDSVLRRCGSRWKAPEFKLFRDVFTSSDPEATSVTNSRGEPEPDADLRDWENIPLSEDVGTYFAREVLPHTPDAWLNPDRKVGYEINFNRIFFTLSQPRPLEVVDSDIDALESRIFDSLKNLKTKRQVEPRSGTALW